METMDSKQVREMLLACADRIIRNEPYLTKVDSEIGDGDHGIGMKNGMKAAKAYLEKAVDEKNVYALYANMAEAMQEAMGGASGMIFSTLFAGKAAEKAPAEELTPEDLANQMKDGLKAGDTVCTYVNGLGSTTLMELMILNRRLRMLLDEAGITVHDMDVNSLVTTMEMAGASISVMKMDEELIGYYDMPCVSPYYTKL